MRSWAVWAGGDVLLLALAGGLLVGTVSAQPEDPTPPELETEFSAEDRTRRALVVATIGERTLTIGQVEDSIAAQSPFLRARLSEPAKMREFVDNMVRFELLGAEAESRGYGENPQVVKATKQNAVQRLMSSQFDERLTVNSIPEEDIVAFYEAHIDEFRREETVRASHILVDDQARARELLGELRSADARAFRDAARRHSIDTETKLRGGDLRFFNREGAMPNREDARVDENIVETAFRIRNVGDLARAPVAVGDNWSIVSLTARRAAEERPVAEASQGIRLRLWREQRQDAIETFVAGLRERLQPEVFEERMRPIRLSTEPSETGGGFPETGHGHGASGPRDPRPVPPGLMAPPAPRTAPELEGQ